MFAPLVYILLAFLGWGIWSSRVHLKMVRRISLWTGGTLVLCVLGLLVATALVIQLSSTVRALVAPGMMDEQPASVALRYLAMRLSAPWVTLLLVGMISAGVALLRMGRFGPTARFSLLLVIAGAAMTLVPEYVYLRDVFGVRLNTIFKFYYQAWVLWAVAAAGAVYTLLFSADRLNSGARRFFGSGLTLMIGLGLVYPLLAIPDRTNEFPEAPTLDGTAYLAREQAADYEAIQWLNTNIVGAPAILEAPGGAYQYEGRVSTQTGLPTLLGWAGHEHQWRGNTVEQSRRLPVVEELCSGNDVQKTLTLLREYDITYVYVGAVERSRCLASSLEQLDRLMETVYNRNGVKIYTWRDALGGRINE
jgi:YYY domain-containing protein